MRLKLLFFIFSVLFSVQSSWSRTYRTEAYTDRIKSVQVSRTDDWESPPVIEMGSWQSIEVKFDEMSHEYKNINYRITHCNADWTPSQLSSIEYLQGFQDMPVNDYLFSFNTTMPYTNYRILFPNEDVSFKVSGNYAVEFYDSSKPDLPLLCACFSVAEPSGLPISVKLSSTTDIDFNKEHQQLSFSLNCKDIRINSPAQELKVFVLQNNRTDNMVKSIQPISILNGQYVYEHNKSLIFEAGNEYRRFEMVTTAYKGPGIDGLDFFSPYYHITLFRDIFRSGKSYIYDQDQNGRYLVRCVQGENSDAEADYFFVHFSLSAQEQLPGNVYIISEAFNYILDSRSQMEYDPVKKTYAKTVLLKQGAYNYMYLLQKDNSSPGTTAITEGNYFETANEYLILVYYKPLGERYDRLIGIKKIENK